LSKNGSHHKMIAREANIIVCPIVSLLIKGLLVIMLFVYMPCHGFPYCNSNKFFN
jgi:hypothetical protein